MSSKFDRDIDDILSQFNDFRPRESGFARARRTMALKLAGMVNGFRALPQAVPADQMMLAALIFIVAAFFLRYVSPGTARLVGLLGLLLFVGAFILSFNQLFGGGRREVRWRGQPIELRPAPAGFVDRLVYWLRRMFRAR